MGDISVKNEGMGDQQGITKNTSGLQKQLSDHARDICENSQKVEVDLLDVCELDETQNKDNSKTEFYLHIDPVCRVAFC
jgi:hypothetical protein